jgi:hypothetical protein
MQWQMRRETVLRDAKGMCFPACPGPEYQYEDRVSGRGAAWLARPSGGRKVESSNLSGPTNYRNRPPAIW